MRPRSEEVKTLGQGVDWIHTRRPDPVFGQRRLRRHHRRPHAEPPRPRHPLDLLLVAVAEEGVYSNLKVEPKTSQDSTP